MKRQQLVGLLSKINLPDGEWVVFGGACLAANNIRSAKDVDIFVTSELYKKLRRSGWEEKSANSTQSIYLRKVYEGVEVQIFTTCGSSAWRPKVKEYIDNPEVIDGMPFMPLREIYEWKAVTRREKDIEDLKLIDMYLGDAQVRTTQ